MYIQISTACNMSCAHCCYAVGAGNPGKHMSLDVFKEILRKWHTVIDDRDGFVVIGGGEPTLHPQFWDIVGASYAYGMTWVMTNGSNKKDALALCEMAKKGALQAVLSLDKWHDPIDPEVVKAFTEGLDVFYHGNYKCMYNIHDKQDKREIRTVIIPYYGGRAKGISTAMRHCPCPGIHFKPIDEIYPCGCEDAPQIGTVEKGVTDIQYKYYDINNGCFKKVNVVYSGKQVKKPFSKKPHTN